jgi:hypothetical protein
VDHCRSNSAWPIRWMAYGQRGTGTWLETKQIKTTFSYVLLSICTSILNANSPLDQIRVLLSYRYRSNAQNS